MKLSVVVISLGRPDSLTALTRYLNTQTRLPDEIIYVVTQDSDVADEIRKATPSDFPVPPRVVLSEKGTCVQRNVGLEAIAPDTDYVAFFDDDYVPVSSALEGIEQAFLTYGPEIIGLSGHLIDDGIKGPGITDADAQNMVRAFEASRDSDFLSDKKFTIFQDTLGLYGCNMALRVAAIAQTRFDPYLPLYAWQEDVDFARRVAMSCQGRLVLTDAFSGVHRGEKRGRENKGRLLGYSQIANNWFLWRKGRLPFGYAFKIAARNFVANNLKAFRSEPWIDRKGRAKGNWIAVYDILRGRSDPRRVLEM